MRLEDTSFAGNVDSTIIDSNCDPSNRVPNDESNYISVLIEINETASANNPSKNNAKNIENQHHESQQEYLALNHSDEILVEIIYDNNEDATTNHNSPSNNLISSIADARSATIKRNGVLPETDLISPLMLIN